MGILNHKKPYQIGTFYVHVDRATGVFSNNAFKYDSYKQAIDSIFLWMQKDTREKYKLVYIDHNDDLVTEYYDQTNLQEFNEPKPLLIGE